MSLEPLRRSGAAMSATCIAGLTGPFSPSAATSLCETFALSSDLSTVNSSLGSELTTFETNVAVRFGDFSNELNVLFLLTTGSFVFIMHAGFAMLCAGAIRHKNTMNILLQTVLDAAVSALAFYVCGFAFAYGIPDGQPTSTIEYILYPSQTLNLTSPNAPNGSVTINHINGKTNGFIGTALFGLSGYAQSDRDLPSGLGIATWQDFLFQWAFAATATTIPAGAVAERFNFNAYLGYSAFISAFVYPVIVHWQWSATGWLGYGRLNGLYHLYHSGMIDYAGSSVVHMVGGMSGLMGCILVGPRLGRFDSSGKPVDMPGHSPTLVVLGTVLLWFGWYGE